MRAFAWRSRSVGLRGSNGPAADVWPMCCRAPRTAPATCLRCKAASTSSDAPSRRSVLLSGLAVVVAPQLLLPWNASAGLMDVQQSLEEYERLESEGKLNSAKAFDNIRAKLNFKRGLDGRVYVKSAKGRMFAVRLDMESPGTMLIRDTDSGEVYGLQTEGFQQIDLTNDAVVIALFSDGNWETAMSPITFEDEDGKVKALKLDEKLFRNLPGLLSATGVDQGDE